MDHQFRHTYHNIKPTLKRGVTWVTLECQYHATLTNYNIASDYSLLQIFSFYTPQCHVTLTPQYPHKNCYLEGEERAHVNERNFFMRVWELPTVACLESVGGDKFVYQFEASKKKRSVETQTNMPNKVQFNWYTLWGHTIHHPTYGRGDPNKFNR